MIVVAIINSLTLQQCAIKQNPNRFLANKKDSFETIRYGRIKYLEQITFTRSAAIFSVLLQETLPQN